MKKQMRFLLRNQKRRISFLLVLCLVIAMFCGSVLTCAAEEEYEYTVRFLAGDKGTFTDGSTVKEYKVDPNDKSTWPSFSNGMVTPTDGKYYVKGIREAGKDNSTVGSSAPTITRDADYVVAYGIKGSSVQYTVEYVDTAGNTLADSQTYYGNEGDRPVVAYLYIDGYFPNAYNITGTLKADSSQNVFRFIYQEIEEEVAEAPAQQTPASTTTTTTTTTGGTTTTTAGGTAAGTAGGTAAGTAAGTAGGAAAGTAGGAAAGAAGGAAAGAAGGTAAGAAGGTAGTEAGTAGGAENANLPETPQAVPEVIDQDVPMAAPESAESSSSSSSAASSSSSSVGTTETISENETPRAGMTGGKIAGIVIAIAAAAAAAIFGTRYALSRKRENSIESSIESETYKFDDNGNLKKKD